MEAEPRQLAGQLRERLEIDGFADFMSHSQRNGVHEILLPDLDGRGPPRSHLREIFEEVLETHPPPEVPSASRGAPAKQRGHRKLSCDEDDGDDRSRGQLEPLALALDIETRDGQQQRETPHDDIRHDERETRSNQARGIPCITTMAGGMAAARAISAARRGEPEVLALQELHARASEVR